MFAQGWLWVPLRMPLTIWPTKTSKSKVLWLSPTWMRTQRRGSSQWGSAHVRGPFNTRPNPNPHPHPHPNPNLGTLLATVALAMREICSTASSPKAMGRVLVHIVLLAGVSSSGAQLVDPRADSSESAAGTSAGPSPPWHVDLDAFYSADVEKVAAFLGPEMHFHHGLASAEVDDLLDRSTDAGPALAERSVAERALADALRILYPHVPLGASVLDVGCGWCGPATLLAAERAASVRGVTIARVQAEFCRARRDVPTLHADVEQVKNEVPLAPTNLKALTLALTLIRSMLDSCYAWCRRGMAATRHPVSNSRLQSY